MFDYNQFNSTYEVDLAILSAVTSGGGGGGGVTPQQVSTMIDSALTPYSTTSETEGMIQASAGTTTAEVEAMVQASAGTTTAEVEAMVQASAGTTTGQVQTQINTTLTAYSTTSEVEQMIQASGGSAGKIDVVLPWNTPATSAETAMAAQIVAEATQIYLASGSTNELFEKYNLYVRVDNEQCAATINSLKYVCDDLSQEFSKVLKIGASTYWDGGLLGVIFSLHGDGTIGDAAAVDVSGVLNSKLSGMGVAMVRALTQEQYDEEGYYDPTTLYIIKPNNQ